MRLRALLLSLLCVPAIPAQDERPKDAAGMFARMKEIGMGDYLIDKQKKTPIGPADVQMCLRALQHDEDDLVARACLCFADFARREFFKKTARADLDRIATLLIGQLDSEHVDAANWSSRALTRFLENDTKDPVLLPAKTRRRIVAKALAMLAHKSLAMQRTAGQMLRTFRDGAGKQVRSEIARTLLTALARLEKQQTRHDQQERKATAMSLKAALAVMQVADRDLAEAIVAALLPDARTLEANHWTFYSAVNALHGVARCFAALGPKQRAVVLAFLREKARDDGLRYMITSGRRTPFRHHGNEALATVVPHLTKAEAAVVRSLADDLRKRAEARLEKAKANSRAFGRKDVESILAPLEAALRDR